jgi:phosphoglucomutase
VTFPRLDALAEGVARWLREERRGGRARIVVAHDTRFLGAALASRARARLAAAGHTPVRAASPVPTPVVAHAVRRGHADAALVFTASHNPPEYQGAKVIAAWGGGVTDAQARRIETHARRALARGAPPAPSPPDGACEDLVAPYLARLLAWVDGGAPRRARPAIVYDALHGAGSGVCDRALRELGARVEVLRGERCPRFGGFAPDPEPAHLAALAARVRAQAGPALGLATDGDGDRYAVVDADGSPLSECEALALLVDRLARTGRLRRGVALSIATGTLVERVAIDHGLAVTRHPIGFKHLARALADGAVDAAGEESGGFAVDAIGRDKDGILACVLFAEMAAEEGLPLRSRLRALARRHGAGVWARIARRTDPRVQARLARLAAAPPERVDGARVEAVDLRDGVRLAFADGFLMLRGSGTEPVLRLYAEAPDRGRLSRRLAAGRALLCMDGGAPAQ